MSETDPEANSEKMKKHNKFDFPADSSIKNING